MNAQERDAFKERGAHHRETLSLAAQTRMDQGLRPDTAFYSGERLESPGGIPYPASKQGNVYLLPYRAAKSFRCGQHPIGDFRLAFTPRRVYK